MKVIIVGCGKVGYILAKNLSAEKDIDITIIDNKADALEKASESIDAMLVNGDGLTASALDEAGARETDLIIAVTEADEKNILCCVSAKRLGVKYTIARVRTPEYALDANKLWKDMGLDLIINPEQETAREISRLLRFPAVDDINIFVGGRVELVTFNISDSPEYFIGESVSKIFYNKNMNVLLATIERKNEIIIPHGDFIFQAGDNIKVLGRPSDIMSFFSRIGKVVEKIKTVTIIGGGRIAHYLVELLHRHSSGTHIKIIELNKEKCEILSVKFPRCLIINGDATDEDILAGELSDKSGAVLYLTDRDEENAIMALYSLQMGIRKVIVKINHINQKMIKNLGLGSIISPKNITSDQITRYVRALSSVEGGVRTIHKIFENDSTKIEAVEFNITKKSKCLNISLKELNMKQGVLIGCIIRGSNIIIPSGASAIHIGDNVIVIAKDDIISEIDDILAD